MVKKVNTALVKLWDQDVGAVTWLEDKQYALFEYEPKFLKANLNIAPIYMDIDTVTRNTIFSFPNLNKDTYLGLPGLLSDCLPDKFGNSIIDAWLLRTGREIASFSPIERLCYTGKRGMGALEFLPATFNNTNNSVPVEISELVDLAQRVVTEYQEIDVNFDYKNRQNNSHAIKDIIRVGTSAGGARPKAVIGIDNKGHVISGQGIIPNGYDYWILKFDGVNDLEIGVPRSYGRIEYAYYLMAKEAGIIMSECRLLEENNRAHFMTKRFDRINGQKIHMQSLCGIAHYDYNMPGAYSYEQAFAIMRKLRLSKKEAIQQYRRMVFNVLAKNLDDHTKNISFLMDQEGKWRLSPAYDITYAHNPKGHWTNKHQMTINGKRENINKNDFYKIAKFINLSKPDDIINEVVKAIDKWKNYADIAGLDIKIMKEIEKYHIG